MLGVVTLFAPDPRRMCSFAGRLEEKASEALIRRIWYGSFCRVNNSGDQRTLRVQVLNSHILPLNLYYTTLPKSRVPNDRVLGPLGDGSFLVPEGLGGLLLDSSKAFRFTCPQPTWKPKEPR